MSVSRDARTGDKRPFSGQEIGPRRRSLEHRCRWKGSLLAESPARYRRIEPTAELLTAVLQDPGEDAVTEAVDAAAGRVGHADLAFVFGTALEDPVAPTAELIADGVVPAVVVTGGTNRSHRDRQEAEVHARLLERQGVPTEAILIENTSVSTLENVLHARPLVEARFGPVQSVIAVAKWYHRRAALTLLNHWPALQQVFTLTYEPGRLDGEPLTRSNWATHRLGTRVAKEYEYLRQLSRTPGIVPITRQQGAWVRSTPPEPGRGRTRGPTRA